VARPHGVSTLLGRTDEAASFVELPLVELAFVELAFVELAGVELPLVELASLLMRSTVWAQV
jgi:hypothetical protein